MYQNGCDKFTFYWNGLFIYHKRFDKLARGGHEVHEPGHLTLYLKLRLDRFLKSLSDLSAMHNVTRGRVEKITNLRLNQSYTLYSNTIERKKNCFLFVIKSKTPDFTYLIAYSSTYYDHTFDLPLLKLSLKKRFPGKCNRNWG